MVSFSAHIADGLFVNVLLCANWVNTVSSCLDVGWLKIVVDIENPKLKNLTYPRKNFIGSNFKIYNSI